MEGATQTNIRIDVHHHFEQQGIGVGQEILNRLTRIEGNQAKSMATEAQLLAKIQDAAAATTRIGEDIKRVLAKEPSISDATMAEMTALADSLIAIDAVVPEDAPPVEPPVEPVV